MEEVVERKAIFMKRVSYLKEEEDEEDMEDEEVDGKEEDEEVEVEEKEEEGYKNIRKKKKT